MLKINASYSKKVPVEGQDFSSQSYHASVEVEIPDGLTAEQLTGRIHETFELVRASVESELCNGNGGASAPVSAATAAPRGGTARKASTDARASGKQISFLTDLAVRNGMDIGALNAEAQRLFDVADIGQLTRKQASQLIDRLNGSPNGQQRRRAA